MVIGQRLRSPGKIFRRGDMPRFALPLFYFMSVVIVVFLMFSIFIILQTLDQTWLECSLDGPL